MNISSWLGAIIISGVLFAGVLKTSQDPFIFLNPQALLLVIGGTLGIALLAFPLRRLQDVLDFLVYGLFLKRSQDDARNVIDIIRLAHFYQINPQGFLQNLRIDYIFLQEAAALLSQERLSTEEIQLILQNRRNSFKKKYQDEYRMLLAISKFPPGLGLLGASAAIIEMALSSQGNALALANASNSLASALVCSFWGLACAHFVLLPLADYAQRVAQEDLFSRDLVIHGVLLAKEGYPVASISEAMISELPIADQMLLRNLIFKSQTVGTGENSQPELSDHNIDPSVFEEDISEEDDQGVSAGEAAEPIDEAQLTLLPLVEKEPEALESTQAPVSPEVTASPEVTVSPQTPISAEDATILPEDKKDDAA